MPWHRQHRGWAGPTPLRSSPPPPPAAAACLSPPALAPPSCAAPARHEAGEDEQALQQQPTLADLSRTPEFPQAQVRGQEAAGATARRLTGRGALPIAAARGTPSTLPSLPARAPNSDVPAAAAVTGTQTMAAFPPAVHDALGLDGLLTPEERALRDRVRAFAVSAPAAAPAARARRGVGGEGGARE